MSGPLGTSEEASDDVTAAVSFLVLSVSSHFSQEIEFRLLFHFASSVWSLSRVSVLCSRKFLNADMNVLVLA